MRVLFGPRFGCVWWLGFKPIIWQRLGLSFGGWESILWAHFWRRKERTGGDSWCTILEFKGIEGDVHYGWFLSNFACGAAWTIVVPFMLHSFSFFVFLRRGFSISKYWCISNSLHCYRSQWGLRIPIFGWNGRIFLHGFFISFSRFFFSCYIWCHLVDIFLGWGCCYCSCGGANWICIAKN